MMMLTAPGFLAIRLGAPCRLLPLLHRLRWLRPISVRTGPLLAAGNQYWVVVTTSAAASQNATTAVWWEANTSNEPFNLNDGNGWNAGFLGGPGGFQVQ